MALLKLAFSKKRLKMKLRLCQKNGIDYRGYTGHPDVMSWHNRQDATASLDSCVSLGLLSRIVHLSSVINRF
jgi:hypothetical protein